MHDAPVGGNLPGRSQSGSRSRETRSFFLYDWRSSVNDSRTSASTFRGERPEYGSCAGLPRRPFTSS